MHLLSVGRPLIARTPFGFDVKIVRKNTRAKTRLLRKRALCVLMRAGVQRHYEHGRNKGPAGSSITFAIELSVQSHLRSGS